jgi:hypothetical protein
MIAALGEDFIGKRIERVGHICPAVETLGGESLCGESGLT